MNVLKRRKQLFFFLISQFFFIHRKVGRVEHFLKLNADIKSYLRFGNSFNPLAAWFWELRCVAPGMVKKMKPAQARYFLRSNVIPLVWQELTVEPFKYNPKLKKEKQMPCYFVQLKVSFPPAENKFIFVEQSEEPLIDAPKYLKAESVEYTSKKS